MVSIIIALVVSALITLIFTPKFTRFLIEKEMGQFIRQDGPKRHLVKRGTPTMGGVMILVAALVGWIVATLQVFISQGTLPHEESLLLLFIMFGMGFVGFIDDFKKITYKQNLGLKPGAKLVFQLIISIIFACVAVTVKDPLGNLVNQPAVSITDHIRIPLNAFGDVFAIVLFIAWVLFLILAWTNAINLTDGLDGLASGCSIISFSAFLFICGWMAKQSCHISDNLNMSACYSLDNMWELGIIAAAIIGALLGFLWWNTNPASIFMGDTGSLALGGAFAGFSILTHTAILSTIIGGIFTLEVFSDVIQVGYFKWKHKRVFKMAPIHHHFELSGWTEGQTVVRFWLLNAALAAIAVVIFYFEWLTKI